MNITSKGRYALRLMVDLAQQADGGYVSLKTCADRQEISLKYLEAIAGELKRAGLLESGRGKEGGYRLSRAPERYTAGEILRCTEENLAPAACVRSGETGCERAAVCRTLPFWQELDALTNRYLDGISLQDLVTGERWKTPAEATKSKKNIYERNCDMFVYADNAATTSVSKTALDAMLPLLTDGWGNPSSLYAFGQQARESLEASRETVAKCLGAKNPREIYFTSGGSEADNQALMSCARAGARKGKKHLISTKFEHHAILHTLKALEKEGFEVTLLDVHKDGVVRVEDVAAAIRDDTCCVSVMFANNEIGTIQPIKEIGTLCREKGIPFHTDAVQAMGHIPVDVEEMNIDMLSLSGHKFHAPKGVGVLYCRKNIPLFSLIEGGAQERGKRAGTENVAGAAALAAALEESCANMSANAEKICAMRDRLFEGLGKIPHSRINGSLEHHVPGTVNMCFEGIEGESLLLLLDRKGVCASSGSACTSGSLDPSHVLLSLGIPHELAHGSLRLSIGEYNTMEEIDHILTVVPQVVAYLRSISPVWDELEKGERPHLC